MFTEAWVTLTSNPRVLTEPSRLEHCSRESDLQHLWLLCIECFVLFQSLSTCSTPPLAMTLSIVIVTLTGWGFTNLWFDGSCALTLQDVKLPSVCSLHLKLVISKAQPPPNCNHSLFQPQKWCQNTLQFLLLPLLCPPYWKGPQIWASTSDTSLKSIFSHFLVGPVYKFTIYLRHCTT